MYYLWWHFIYVHKRKAAEYTKTRNKWCMNTGKNAWYLKYIIIFIIFLCGYICIHCECINIYFTKWVYIKTFCLFPAWCETGTPVVCERKCVFSNLILAFDTIDHKVLFISRGFSFHIFLFCGIPQGSILGPIFSPLKHAAPLPPIHPFIFCCSSKSWLWWQKSKQGNQDIFLLSHVFQLHP